MKKILLIASFLCAVFTTAFAQQISVQGMITDSLGNPSPNVQVIITDASTGNPVGWTQSISSGTYFWLDTIGGLPIGTGGTLDVSVIDCNGSISTQTFTYTPNQLNITANFAGICSGNQGGGSGGGSCGVYIPLPFVGNGSVSISANGTGGVAPYTYVWDMGDSSIYTTQTANHTYAANGTYTVCVTIVDATGCVATQCINITITGVSGGNNCTVAAHSFVDSTNSLMYHFTTSQTGASFPVTYVWDFGDGNTSTSATPTHTYSTTGTYTVCVTATDANGCISNDCILVHTISQPNCFVFMNYNYPAPATVDFSAQAIGVGAISYLWDFGDGNVSTQANPTHFYSLDGIYTVMLTTTDASGCIATTTNSVVINTQCDATFTTAQVSGNTYTFLPNSTNLSSLYLWDFGDGNIDSLNTSPTHTYTQSGTYLACLAIIDIATGCFDTYCDTIIVGTASACQASIQYTNAPGSLTVNFSGSSTGTGPFVYDWDFGDGNSSISQNPTHTYNTIATGPVTFPVTLTVTDATGCMSVTTEIITVFGANPNGQIIGYLWKDTFNLTPADGLVYLIEYDSLNGSLTAIDTVLTQQGVFNFLNVPAGDYLVKAALEPTDPDYANYLPTYFVQSLSWNSAQYVGPAPFGVAFIDIQLVAGNNPGGAGFIGGLVVNGAGRPVNGNQTLVENINSMEPIEGASVLLLDANGNAVTHTTTDETGAYSFNGIAMGTYNVHVEEVGKVTFPANIVVDANNMNHTEVHFTVHESMVTLTGVYEVANIEGLNVFPNPVNDAATVQIELVEAMDLTLTVTNLMGQEVINTNKRLLAGENTFSVEMNNLPTGLYLMSLKSGSDVVTYKIQKN